MAAVVYSGNLDNGIEPRRRASLMKHRFSMTNPCSHWSAWRTTSMRELSSKPALCQESDNADTSELCRKYFLFLEKVVRNAAAFSDYRRAGNRLSRLTGLTSTR
jgi:hypothetical protein